MASAHAGIAADFTLQDGDHVVFLGNTLIEREQRYGYWETILTTRFPAKNITFRNLGWSGDTVFGQARARFGSAADGFQHLKDHVLALKPTVIFVGYGSNESFEGEAGLPHFLQGLGVLLDTIAQTKARIILLSPLRHEDLGRPLPDPSPHNKNVQLYRNALRTVAAQRGHPFVDFYELLGDGAKANPPAPLTDNGIHLTAYGYWRAAAALERGLRLAPPRWQHEVDLKGKPSSDEFSITSITLPLPSPAGASLPGYERVLRIRGLSSGKYALKIDGQTVALATADEWASGVKLERGPEWEQVERLRQTIIEKNLLYFHRWRPQNETYLFGFRKQEQGQNAKEIPQFDPLVAKLEKDIAKLCRPVSHRYQFIPQKVDK
jgi:lysophospholipase L1-like esterase